MIMLTAALLSAGCAQSLYTQGRIASEDGDYATALTRLYEAVGEAPGGRSALFTTTRAS